MSNFNQNLSTFSQLRMRFIEIYVNHIWKSGAKIGQISHLLLLHGTFNEKCAKMYQPLHISEVATLQILSIPEKSYGSTSMIEVLVMLTAVRFLKAILHLGSPSVKPSYSCWDPAVVHLKEKH